MSDPLSLAAAGAGFASLGLTICDGIYKYIDACVGKPADMRQLRETADDLKSVVALIEERLVRVTPSASAALIATKTAIEGRITSCNAAAKCILELVEKHEPARAGAQMVDRIKRLARAGIYPMRRESLMELQQACQRYNLNLVLLLQLFEVDGISELRDALVVKMDVMNTAASSNLSSLEQRFLTVTSAEATRVVRDTRNTVIQSRDALVQEINAASSRTEACIISAGQSNVTIITEAGAGHSQRTQDVILQRLDSAEARTLSSQQHLMSASEARSEALGNRISQELQAGFASRLDTALLQSKLESLERVIQGLYVANPAMATAPMQGSNSRTPDQHGSLPTLANDSMLTASGCRRPPTRERRPRLADGVSPGSAQAIERGCTCTAPVQVQVSQPRRYFGSLWLRSEESVVHHRNCPLWYLSRRRRTFHINYSAFGFAVYGPIEVENSPFYWLKQLHIDPKLSFRSVVPSGSPGFLLLKDILRNHNHTLPYPNMGRRPDSAGLLERGLLELFQRGEASPTDVDPNGNNLLHALFHTYNRNTYLNLASAAPNEFMALAPVLFKMGVPRWQTNNDGRIPTAAVLESDVLEFWRKRTGHLMDTDSAFIRAPHISAELSISAHLVPLFHASDALGDPETWCGGVVGMYLQTQYEWCAQITSPGRPLSIASAQGDVDKVRSILDISPELLAAEKNDLSQTPLHLAVRRPAVLALLLACSTYVGSIIDHKDCTGHSAMCYALRMQSSQALLMLSKSGASLEPAITLLDTAHFKYAPAIYQWFAKVCRTRLEELIRLGIVNGCASDAQLAQFPHSLELFNAIARALREKGVQVPVSISSAISHKPFGHLRGLNVDMAESLWDNGIFKLDEGHNGVFPILRQASRWVDESRGIEGLQDWVWSKNPRLDLPTAINGLQVAYILAAGCGDLRYSSDESSQLRRTSWSHAPPARFNCFCIGSTSIFIPFRQFEQPYIRLCLTLEACCLDGLVEEHSSDILRALTFGALELTHTCPLLHNPYVWGEGEDFNCELRLIEAVEIERIHDEEEELITRLESLLDELVREHHERPLPFPEFLAVVWFPRIMDEVGRCDPRTKRYLDEVMEWLVERQRVHMPELKLEEINKWLMSDGEGDDHELKP
ncbi:hypothetical protein RB595_006480 [Gaeumannomyces hyphopodioides]